MTPDSLKSARAKFGLTQTELGQLIGATSRMIRMWEHGTLGARTISIPRYVEIIITLMLERPRLRKEIIERWGKPQTPAAESDQSEIAKAAP